MLIRNFASEIKDGVEQEYNSIDMGDKYIYKWHPTDRSLWRQ